MSDTLALPLGDINRLAEWMGLDHTEIDQQLHDSLEAAREAITAEIDRSRLPSDGTIPASLHRATVMLAAQIEGRSESTYGVEALSLGGEAGGFISSDPQMRRLLRRWKRASVGGSTGAAT